MRWLIGVDPSAGSWETAMRAGPRPTAVAVVALEAEGPRLEQLTTIDHNRELLALCEAHPPAVVAVDGPCRAPCLPLAPDRRGWGDLRDGTRAAERALVAAGHRVFWTSRGTAERFDGAARWIARSLVLFAELEAAGLTAIETYPQAVFVRRAPGELAHKRTAAGRQQRRALLRSWLTAGAEPLTDADDHALDAVACAWVAADVLADEAVSFGDDDGGRIWLPPRG